MSDVAKRMDQQYRYQRYVYDWSRKYYLFGRDTLLQDIQLEAGQHLLEIGCGTGRNLVKLAYRYPLADLYGLDASQSMLDIAAQRMDAHFGTKNPIQLRQGLAQQVSGADFGQPQGFDHVLVSYVFSMIPDRQAALHQALACLKPNGYLHVVDFADLSTTPEFFRNTLLTWLKWFHVEPDLTVMKALQESAEQKGCHLAMRYLPGRYAALAHYQHMVQSSRHIQWIYLRPCLRTW